VETTDERLQGDGYVTF